jgi:Ricin-type beta-trefoil lectin domain
MMTVPSRAASGQTVQVAQVTATTAARVGPASLAPPPRPRVLTHQAFDRALRTVTSGKRAGIVLPRAAHQAARSKVALAGCTEPDCELAYNGGQVQHSPHVYLLLWGDWSSSTAQEAYSYLYYFYQGLGVSPRDTWSTVTSQYGDGSGSPVFGSPVLVSVWQATSAPPNPVTFADLAAEAETVRTAAGITDLTDAQVVVAAAPGTCFSDGFAGNCGSINQSGGYCAWHSVAADSSGNLPFTNLPFQLDAGSECGENWINSGQGGQYDGFTVVGGHEYAETITDPFPDTGWYDPADTISGGEVADKCAWGGTAFGVTDPVGDITLSTGTFAVQSLWSNAYGRCMMTSAPHLSVSNPGTQNSKLGKTVSLQIQGATNTSMPLTYTATGLPPGLRMNSAGHITGDPVTTAGTWHAQVKVTDPLGAATAAFSWRVSSAAGPVKGYDAKCADDSGGRTANGNKIDLWACTGKAPQEIAFTAGGELQVVGKCITASTTAVLQPCAGIPAQTWTHQANGEYVIKSSGQCLTDPKNSKTNGTKLHISGCTNAADQHWSLP